MNYYFDNSSPPGQTLTMGSNTNEGERTGPAHKFVIIENTSPVNIGITDLPRRAKRPFHKIPFVHLSEFAVKSSA